MKILILSFILTYFSSLAFSNYSMSIEQNYFDNSYKDYLFNKFISNKQNYNKKIKIFKNNFLIPVSEINFKKSEILNSYNEFENFNKNFVEIFKNNQKKKFINFDKYQYEIFEVDYYGTKSFGLYIRNKFQDNKNLSIVSTGQFVFDAIFTNNLETYNFLLKNSDIFIIYPFNTGLNSNYDISFPISFDKKKSFIHSFKFFDDKTYANYLDVNNTQIMPFAIVISGNYYLLKKFTEIYKYDIVNIYGFSQGAYNANILSAFISEIDNSYIVNGVIPKEFNFEKLQNIYKIFEYNSFYSVFDQWDIFFLSLISLDNVHLIFNKNDKHNSSNTDYFKKFYDKLKRYIRYYKKTNLNVLNNLDIFLYEGSNDHKLELKKIEQILN